MTDKLQDRRHKPVWIHSRLDELGLTLEAFRIYCHLARRAGNKDTAWPSYASMASSCLRGSYPNSPLSSLKRKAMDAVKELEAWGLIAVERSQHRADGGTTSNTYCLSDESEWNLSAQITTRNIRTTGRKNQATPAVIDDTISSATCDTPPSATCDTPPSAIYDTPPSAICDTSLVQPVTLPSANCDTPRSYSIEVTPINEIQVEVFPPTPQGEIPRECDYPARRKNLALGRTSPTSLPDNTGEIQAKPVPVEFVCSAAPVTQRSKKYSAAGDDLLDEKLTQLLERYNRGEIGKLPEPELKMLAAAVMGDTVQLYRRSGKVLSSAPNDIDRKLMQFIAIRDKQDFVYGTRLIAAMERTPSRWGELVELVAAWQLGDVNTIPNAAKQIALHSRLQQNKQSTFEAIKDL